MRALKVRVPATLAGIILVSLGQARGQTIQSVTAAAPARAAAAPEELPSAPPNPAPAARPAVPTAVPPTVPPASPVAVPPASPVITPVPAAPTVVPGPGDSVVVTHPDGVLVPSAEPVHDACPTCGPGCAPACCAAPAPQACLPRCEIWGDALYLKVRGTDITYAQPRDGLTPISAPLGAQGALEPTYAPGFRVGMDYALNTCSKIEASASWWESQTHSFLAAPATPPGAVIFSNVTFPTLMNVAADSLTADGSFSIEFRTAELAYKRVLCGQYGLYTVNWLVGGRYAYMKQNLHTDFTILGATAVDSLINFDGAGPRIGLDGELFGKHGFHLYGRGTLDVLAGHFGASMNQFNVFAGEQGNINYKSDRIVPIVELEVGVGYTSPKGHLRVSGGYTMATWFNTVNTPDFIDSVRANNFTNNGNNLKDSMTFDGVTGRLEFRF